MPVYPAAIERAALGAGWTISAHHTLIPGAAPTALQSFTATVTAGTVALAWSTIAETPGNLFHIQRATARDGPYTRVNSDPLPATGSPRTYRLIDHHPPGGVVYYRVEDTDTAATTRVRGPVRVQVPYRLYHPALPR